MLSFYLIAGGLAVLAAAALVRPLVAGRAAAESRDARDAQVFRDQLAEIERDLARGTITPAEAEGARAEVSRRLIAAAERARRGGAAQPAPQGHSGLVAGLALVGTPAVAAALYFALGAPGIPDHPLAGRTDVFAAVGGGVTQPRPGQAEAEAQVAGQLPPRPQADPQYAGMIDQLEAVLADRPDDLQGHRLLASGLANLGRYSEAWRTYERVIELSGGTADAATRAAKAEAMILAAGGYVSPEAEGEIARALELDPTLPIARYYGGLALRQSGRVNEAIAMWRDLRRDSPPDAAWLGWLDTMLAEAEQSRDGGVPAPARQQTTPTDRSTAQADAVAGAAGAARPPGPTAADVAAAGEMPPEDRAAMVEGMVARLESRLTGQGGSAEEWLRLIDSYVKLGRDDDAARAYRLAARALADDPAAGFVREQALLMGVPVE